eukprot:824080-Alexandrium_andersonii.AAC.1
MNYNTSTLHSVHRACIAAPRAHAQPLDVRHRTTDISTATNPPKPHPIGCNDNKIARPTASQI